MSLKLLLVVGLAPMILARPDVYKETEDFQYSRSDSDHGQKAGFYAAQRGNMGGNFEKSHNMDHLAQNQMTGLAQQVSGQLEVDPAALNGHAGQGSIYGSASASGTTSLNQQRLTNQGLGTSRLAGTKSAGYTRHGGLSSQSQNQLGYGEEYYAGSADRQSHETQQAYEARQRLASNSRLSSQTQSNFGSRIEGDDTYQQTAVRPLYPGRPGRVTHVMMPVRSQAAYDAQSRYTGGTADGSTGSAYNRESETANTEFVNENQAVKGQSRGFQYNAANAQAVDDLATSQYNQRQDQSSRQAQNLNNGRTNRYQYDYNKQWERHGTVVPNTVHTEVGNVETGSASNVRNLQTDYNALSHNTEDQALDTGSRQEYAQRYGKTHGFRTVPSTSVNYLSTDALTRSAGRNTNFEEQNVATTNLRSAASSTNQAHRAQTNFNTGTASQALETGTAYNTDVELLNGQSLGTNLDLGRTVVTTAPKSFESSYSYRKAWERKGTPYVIQPVSSSLTDNNWQGALTNDGQSESLLSHRATDQSSGQRNYYTKGGSQASALSSSNSHSTGIGSQSSLTESMARLQETLQQQQERMRASLCDAECASAKSNKYEASYAYSRQHAYRKKRSPVKENLNDYDYGKNDGDLDQQMEDFGQMPEDLGQMPEDFGQLPEEFGKLPENLGQMPLDFSPISQTFNQGSKLGKTLGEQQGKTDYNNLQPSRAEAITARIIQEKTIGEQLVEADYNYLQQSRVEAHTVRNTREKTLGEQLVEADYNNLQRSRVEAQTVRNTGEKTLGEQLVEADYNNLQQSRVEAHTVRNTGEKTLGEQLVETDYNNLQRSRVEAGNTQEESLGEQLVQTDYKILQLGQSPAVDNEQKTLTEKFVNPDYDSSREGMRPYKQLSTRYVPSDRIILRDNFFDELHKQSSQLMHNFNNDNFGEPNGNFDKSHSYHQQVLTSASLEKPFKSTFDDMSYGHKYEQYPYNYRHQHPARLNELSNSFNLQKETATPIILDKPGKSDNPEPIDKQHFPSNTLETPLKTYDGNSGITKPVPSFSHEHHYDRQPHQPLTSHYHHKYEPFLHNPEFHNNPVFLYNAGLQNNPGFSQTSEFRHQKEFYNNPALPHNLQVHHNPVFHHNSAFHQDPSDGAFVPNMPFQFTSQPYLLTYPFRPTLTLDTTQTDQDFGRSPLETNFKEQKTMENQLGLRSVATTEDNPHTNDINKIFDSFMPGLIIDDNKSKENQFNTYSAGQTLVSYNYSEANIQHYLVPSSTARNKLNRHFPEPNERATVPSIDVEIEDDLTNPTTKVIPNFNDEYHNQNMPRIPKNKTPAEIEILSLVRHETESQLNHEINSDDKEERARGDIPTLDEENKHSYNPLGETMPEKTLVYSGDALVIRPKTEKPKQNFKSQEDKEQYDEQNLDQQIEDLGQELVSFDEQREDVATLQIGNNNREITTERTSVHSGYAPVSRPKTEKPKQHFKSQDDKEQYDEQNLDQQIEDLGQELVSFDEQKEDTSPLQIGNNHSEKPFMRPFVSDQNDMDWSIGGPKSEHGTREDNHNMPNTPKIKSPAEIQKLSLVRDQNERQPNQYNINPHKQKERDNQPEQRPTRQPTYYNEQLHRRPSSYSTKPTFSEIDNLEQQIEVDQEIEEFNWKPEKPGLDHNLDFGLHTLEKIDRVDSKPNQNDKKPDAEMPFDIDKILNEELKDLEAQNSIYKQHENKEKLTQEPSTHAHTAPTTESVNKFEKSKDLEQSYLEELGQQSDTAGWNQEIEKLQGQYDQVEQALDKLDHPEDNPNQETFILDVRIKPDVVNNDNIPTLNSLLQEGEKVIDDSDKRALEAAPAEEKLGFWQNMGKKFSKTKNKVASWFS